MSAQPVIAIIDVGKTNKKLFLFDRHYKIVFERTARFVETIDDDGFPCENVESLRLSVFESLHEIIALTEFEIKAVNFSTYGASFVNLGSDGNPITPLYNYLKPFPAELKKQFYDTYGGEESFSYKTASPVLGHLNSGMQLYWLKYAKPDIYKQIIKSLHLPQYISYLVTGKYFSDITSIGCHTNLWDFTKEDYHEWVYKEGVIGKLAPVSSGEQVVEASFEGRNIVAGIGLHDSSAALIPYLVSFQEPFVLISTGTWCISLNPFNQAPLTIEELRHDCLSFLSYEGRPVKAARLFAGNEHEEQVKRIAEHFNQNTIRYRTMEFDRDVIAFLREKFKNPKISDTVKLINESLFAQRDLSSFESDDQAYHQLMLDIMTQQRFSTQLILNGSEVKRMFVDGGFSKNSIYMNLLAEAFPGMEVFAASMAQATALGTALAIHKEWNEKPLPNDLIELKYYSIPQEMMR
ncbi:FGGY family carbohydrate kinase [Segetibacter sp.]|uniref:FGGY-family carbohydrate kinase n=1 Tax=Segetibacter sp. TaxID=2231182 RepID=UPI00262C3C0D|nr:FGGY family carbohydrate kinase [Segetibacter sp.]MCW3080298.1 carbohydrate kinase [Segetibacter sp.]